MFKALAGGIGMGVRGLQVNEGVAAREVKGKGKGGRGLETDIQESPGLG